MGTPAYDKVNCTRVNLKLNNKTDADIIQHLRDQESIQGYIKSLIRADMKEENTMSINIEQYHVTMDDFDQFDPWPTNWEEIADFLNGIIDSRIESMIEANNDFSDWLEVDQYRECKEISEKVWEQYCAGDLDGEDGCPVIIPRD